MYPKNLKDIENAAVRSRVAIERRIVTSLVNELLSRGFLLSVDDGEEEHPRTSDSAQLFDQLMNTDEDRLYVYHAVGSPARIGWIYLVYGNDGWDVMSDWTTILDQFIPKTLALVEELG